MIELCMEPDQILCRLRLLRRISYLKLRGYEWPLLRKMYTAILTSIETGEYSWTSNFDRFETLLYRRSQPENKFRSMDNRHTEYDNSNKKWFCRDYNPAGGCTKASPHTAWFGSGPTAVRRQVHHWCGLCLLRDRQQK